MEVVVSPPGPLPQQLLQLVPLLEQPLSASGSPMPPPMGAMHYCKDLRCRKDWVDFLRLLPRPAAVLGWGSVVRPASPVAAFSLRIFAWLKEARLCRFPTLDCSDSRNLASGVSLISIVSLRFQSSFDVARVDASVNL